MLSHRVVTTTSASAQQLWDRTNTMLFLLTQHRVLRFCRLCVFSISITSMVVPIYPGRNYSNPGNHHQNIPASIQDENPSLCAVTCNDTIANKTNWAKED